VPEVDRCEATSGLQITKKQKNYYTRPLEDDGF
jgi:hypothetical protein